MPWKPGWKSFLKMDLLLSLKLAYSNLELFSENFLLFHLYAISNIVTR